MQADVSSARSGLWERLVNCSDKQLSSFIREMCVIMCR